MITFKPILIKQFIVLSLLLITGVNCHIFTINFIYLNKVQKVGEQKYYEFYNIEMVPDKPDYEYIAYPEPVSLYNQQIEKFGEILKTPVLYSHMNKESSADSLLPITIYGWVWNKSLDSNNQLKTDENIRYWSNSHIIANINAGFHLDTNYTNEKKSWTLVTFDGLVPIVNLLTREEFKDIPKWERFFSNQSIKRTVTRRSAGRAIHPTTRPLFKYEDFNWQFRLVILIVSFTVITGVLLRWYIPSGIQNKKRRLIRAIIAFLAGLLVGSIFWF